MQRSDGVPDDKTPDMKETGHTGKTNGGMYKEKARFGQTIVTPYPLDRSTMYGPMDEECGYEMAGDEDNLEHSIKGAKAINSQAVPPRGRKDTTIKGATR